MYATEVRTDPFLIRHTKPTVQQNAEKMTEIRNAQPVRRATFTLYRFLVTVLFLVSL